jgi:hypothetical protein
MDVITDWDNHDRLTYTDWNRIQANINTITGATIYSTEYTADSFLTESDYRTAFQTVEAVAVALGILKSNLTFDELAPIYAVIQANTNLTILGNAGTVPVTADGLNALEASILLIYNYELLAGRNTAANVYARSGGVFVGSGTYGRGVV